ncbi:MAG TPA: Ig-like domain-containing protein [Methylomirabilota bacterium]|jgi:hypothetical protein|nr:Ig-like domain-containing protein [Methylomirabilota bacterium]
MYRVLSAVLGLVAVLVAVAPAAATVVVPVTEADLVAQAAAVVIGRVTAIESHAHGGRVFTNVTLAVEEMLKGDSVPTLTVRLLGGRVGDHVAWIDGSPEFRRGERVLVFLTAHRDGTPRIAHFYQGKFSIVADAASGEDLAVRVTPEGVHLPGGAAAPATVSRRLRHFRDAIRAQVSAHPAPRGRGHALVSATAPATAVTESLDTFALLGSPSRWFEPDGGQPVRMLINSSGEPLAPGNGVNQIRDAFAAWSGVSGSSFRYADGGFTSAAGFQNDGVNAISFRDPLGDIDPPVNCSGTLAYGGYWRSGETRVVNGQSFYRIIEGDIVFADGWNGCGFYETYANLAEVATHELGHVLGLDHPTDPDATMYAYAHFDGRGAALRASDLAGLRYIYPAPTPVPLALAFTAPAENATVSGTTTVTLAATGGTGYAYTLRVDGTTVYTGAGTSYAWNTSAVANGTHTLAATVTDSLNRTATASRSVLVNNVTAPPPPTGGTLDVGLTQPTAGTTVKGTAWAVVWITGATGTSNSVTLTLGGRTVGTITSASAGPISLPYDTTLAPDGTQTLTASVRDAAGNTGSKSVSVVVANGTTPPPPAPTPLSAAIGTPAAGATVTGTVTVTMSAAGGTTPYTYTLALDGTTLTSGSATSYAWNTATTSNASHTLSLTVRDGAGATATATRTVTVSNTVTPPPTPLSAAIGTPAAGATVTGTVTVTMSAAGGTAPYTYTLALDGTTLTSGSASSYAWNTATASNASHTLTLTARDGAGTTATATRTVTVSNTVTPPPTGTLQVAITQPTAGTTVKGTAWAVVWLSGTTGSSNSVTLMLGGQTVGTTTSGSAGPISLPYNTTLSPDGVQMLTATARDASGNTGTRSVSVNVANGAVTPPPAPAPLAAAFTAPAAGATVSGTTTVMMSGTGGTAPYTYTLALDGTTLTSGTSSSYAWNTLTASNAAHTLTLTVRDGAGATATATLGVTVSNTVTPPPPPPPTGTLKVYITQPASGATVSGTAWTTLWVEGTSGTSNTFTLSANGTVIATQVTGSRGPVTMAWVTSGTANGPAALTATVRDAAGNTGSLTINVTVRN